MFATDTSIRPLRCTSLVTSAAAKTNTTYSQYSRVNRRHPPANAPANKRKLTHGLQRQNDRGRASVCLSVRTKEIVSTSVCRSSWEKMKSIVSVSISSSMPRSRCCCCSSVARPANVLPPSSGKCCSLSRAGDDQTGRTVWSDELDSDLVDDGLQQQQPPRVDECAWDHDGRGGDDAGSVGLGWVNNATVEISQRHDWVLLRPASSAASRVAVASSIVFASFVADSRWLVHGRITCLSDKLPEITGNLSGVHVASIHNRQHRVLGGNSLHKLMPHKLPTE